ncbi:MAG: hypothetical protein GY953_45835, partial [bacterium]|nr:hypothetical protein [bacterium]
MLLLVSALGVYQLLVLKSFEALSREAHALVASPLPETGSNAHRQFEQDAQAVIQKQQTFSRRHFAALWRLVSQRDAVMLHDRIRFLNHQLGLELGRCLLAAEGAEMRGKAAEARQLYEQISVRGVGTSWEREARAHLTKLKSYASESNELLERAELALKAGNVTSAFLIFREVMFKYRRSAAARSVRLPIRMES